MMECEVHTGDKAHHDKAPALNIISLSKCDCQTTYGLAALLFLKIDTYM